MSEDNTKLSPLNQNQKEFCQSYILDWNGTRAYLSVYKNVKSETVARVNASRLLTNANIQNYISEIQKDLEKIAGISRLKVLNEYQKIAFNSISQLHNTWIELKEFQALTEDQKSCIESIETKVLKRDIGTRDNPDIIDVEYVKIKLFDKTKALDSINKMLGYNEPDKIDHTTKGEKMLLPPIIIEAKPIK